MRNLVPPSLRTAKSRELKRFARYGADRFLPRASQSIQRRETSPCSAEETDEAHVVSKSQGMVKRYALHFKRNPIKHTSQAKFKRSLCCSFLLLRLQARSPSFQAFRQAFDQALSSPAIQSVGPSRFERRRPREAAALAVADAVVAAVAAVPSELPDVEGANGRPSVTLSSVSMSSAARRSELDVVAVFAPSASPSLFAEVDASLSFSSMALMRL